MDAIQSLINGSVPIDLSTVLKSDADLLSVTYDGRPFANLALAFIENSYRKWMSSNNIILIEKNGRWVQTYGLGTHLIYSRSNQVDPLSEPTSISHGTTWSRKIDWNNDHYGHVLKSTFHAPLNSSLDLFDSSIDVFIITEDVRYFTGNERWQPNKRWTNLYWFHSKSGKLLKSQQTLSANDGNITSVYLSRAAKIVSKN